MAGEIGKGYKIIYWENTGMKNGEGVIIDEKIKPKVIKMIRKSDWVIIGKVMLEDN